MSAGTHSSTLKEAASNISIGQCVYEVHCSLYCNVIREPSQHKALYRGDTGQERRLRIFAVLLAPAVPNGVCAPDSNLSQQPRLGRKDAAASPQSFAS